MTRGVSAGMSINIPVVVLYLLLSLSLTAFHCEARRVKPTFKEPTKYCGPRLTQYLHEYCEAFYGIADQNPTDPRDRKEVYEECCISPCSILYMVLVYCKKPKADAIKATFGVEEFNLYENLKNNSTDRILSMETLNGTLTTNRPAPTSAFGDGERNFRRKKHIRKGRRRKERCICKEHAEMQKKKHNLLLNRSVPDYKVGVADYQDNEPIIIANLV